MSWTRSADHNNQLIDQSSVLIGAAVRRSINLINDRSAHARRIGTLTRWCHHSLLRCLWSRRRPRAGSDPPRRTWEPIDPGIDWSGLISSGATERGVGVPQPDRRSVCRSVISVSPGVFLQVTVTMRTRESGDSREGSLWADYWDRTQTGGPSANQQQ